MHHEVTNLIIKYRPRTFTDFLGNEQTKRACLRMLESGRHHSGILITGDKGTGKTTLAELIAASMNCTFRNRGSRGCCGECHSCIDIRARKAAVVGHGCFYVNCADLTLGDLKILLEHAEYGWNGELVIILDEAQRTSIRIQDFLVTHMEDPRENSTIILVAPDPEPFEEAIFQRVVHLPTSPPCLDEVVALLARIANDLGASTNTQDLVRLCAENGNIPRRCIKALENRLYFD